MDFSAAEAALRETREEIGIATDRMEVRGPLEPVYTSVSNYLLIPFVAFAEETPAFVPNPSEVAEVIELPFRSLLDPRSVEEERWRLHNAWQRVSFYRHGEHKIWGATARVLRQIVKLAGGPPPPPQFVLPGEVEPVRFATKRGS
jgi:8-oxo-dGTP pyrophosphatase MutT (NUDIX family)